MFRRDKFIPGNYYHIYDRTILGLPEFKDYRNAQRLKQAFIFANSTNSTAAFHYLRNARNATFEKALEIASQGEKLVDILCYVIMPEHYHLLLREKEESGISSFVHKCNISVAKYINIKNDRSGSLFESLFQSKHISTNEYLLHLSLYIHLNPLDFLSGRGWRNHGLKDWASVKNKLLNYPWSSLRCFLGQNHEDLVVSGTGIIVGQFEDSKEYEKFLREWSEDSLAVIKEIL